MGIPSMTVISKPFLALAQMQARSVGVPDLPLIVLPKSFGNVSLEDVAAEVDQAAELAVAEILKLRG